MKVSPTQLAILCVAAFGAIVGLNIFTSMRSNAEFKTKLENLNPVDMAALRARIVNEENMTEPEEVAEVYEID